MTHHNRRRSAKLKQTPATKPKPAPNAQKQSRLLNALKWLLKIAVLSGLLKECIVQFWKWLWQVFRWSEEP